MSIVTTSRVGRAAIALVLVVALLLTGTFAWQSQQQQALNQARGAQFPGGRLHDDFEVIGPNFGEHVWEFGVRANKDVYVENFNNIRRIGPYATAAELTASLDGRATLNSGYVTGFGHVAYVELRAQPLFVALRVFEYMEFGDGALLDPDPHHYTAFSGPDGSATGVTTTNAARGVTSLAPGAERYDVTTWTLREWDNYSANTLLFRNFWNWELGGQKQFMPTFNRDNESEESDVKGDAVAHTFNSEPLRGGEVINETIRRVDNVTIRPNVAAGQDVYPATAGTHVFFVTQPTWTARAKFNDDGAPGITQLPITQTARPTLNAEIIYMAAWIAEDFSSVTATSRETFVGWILDVDGWAYWSQMLEAGDATGLLIDEIEFVGRTGGSWYYAIHIESSIVSFVDLDDLAPGRTTNGDDVVEWLEQGSAPGGGTPTLPAIPPVGETFTYNGIVWRVLHDDGAGNRLIMTEHVHMVGAPYNVTNVYTRLGESNARTALNNWWAPNVTGALRAAALPALNVENDVRDAWTDNWDVTEIGNAGLTAPGAGTVAANGSNALFILSLSEAAMYFDYEDFARIAFEPGGSMDDPQSWWLRSPGGRDQWKYASRIETCGQPVPTSAHSILGEEGTGDEFFVPVGLRPAMWIHVGEAPILPPIPPVGGTFAYNGIEWRVLYADGAGNHLILTESVHMLGTQYNLTNVYTRLGESNARAALNNWWAPNVTGALRNAAVPALNVENDVRSDPTPTAWGSEQGAAGMSAPGTGTVAANGSNALFILSVSEENAYFTNTSAARQVVLYDGRWASWWLRSPGHGDSSQAVVNNVGNLSGTWSHWSLETRGLRPAMWINTN